MDLEESEHLLFTPKREDLRPKFIATGVILIVALLVLSASWYHKPGAALAPSTSPLPIPSESPAYAPAPNVVCGFTQIKENDIPPPAGAVGFETENELGIKFALAKIRWNGKEYTSAHAQFNPSCSMMHLSLWRKESDPALFLIPVHVSNSSSTAKGIYPSRIEDWFATYTTISVVTSAAQQIHLLYNHVVHMDEFQMAYWLNKGFLQFRLREMERTLLEMDSEFAQPCHAEEWPPSLGEIQQLVGIDYAATKWQNYRFVQFWEGVSLFFFLFYADFGGHLCFFSTRPSIDPPHANATLMQLQLPDFSPAIQSFYFYSQS